MLRQRRCNRRDATKEMQQRRCNRDHAAEERMREKEEEEEEEQEEGRRSGGGDRQGRIRKPLSEVQNSNGCLKVLFGWGGGLCSR